MQPETGTAAACSKEMLAGLRTSVSVVPIANSAKEPLTSPITSSPGRRSVTFAPTASTRPATSLPRTAAFIFLNPGMSRAKYGLPVMMCHTSGPQPAARTCTRTSSSPTTGSATSRNSSTSAEPNLS